MTLGFMKSKKSIGHEVAASIIFSAMKNNDNVGLGIFTDKLEQFVPARKGRKHSLSLLRTLLAYKPKSTQTDIPSSLLQLHRILGQQSVVFIISDYISPNFLRPLKFLKNRHDVILVNLSDIRESELPDIGYTMLEDIESGEQLMVNTSDASFRHAFTKNSLEIVQVYTAEQELGGIKKDLKENADAHCKDFDKTADLKSEEFILRGQTKFVVYSCK